MRGALIALWLLIPFALAAYHYGPGQEGLQLDRVDQLTREAERLARDGLHAAAVAKWDEALQAIPAGQVATTRRARLERDKSAMLASGLPEARLDLQALMEEVQADPQADPAFAGEVRTALASAQFYYTWLLKLEGQPREVWEPEVEAARQHYSLLAEQAPTPELHQERQADLEATVRLALMDPDELQGLKIPDQ